MVKKIDAFVSALNPKEKIDWEKLIELGLNKEEAHSAFPLPFEIRDTLEQLEAKDYVLSLDVDWNNFPLVSHDPAAMMDVDPSVFYWPGVLICSGGSFDDLKLNFDRTLIIEGDLIVDGMFENNCMVLVTGDLICRSIMNVSRNYLLVLGNLKTTGLVGSDEGYGTYICGDAEIETAVFLRNHHMGVAGSFGCRKKRHDEFNIEEEIIDVLSGWGHPNPSEYIDLDSVVEAMKSLKMPS